MQKYEVKRANTADPWSVGNTALQWNTKGRAEDNLGDYHLLKLLNLGIQTTGSAKSLMLWGRTRGLINNQGNNYPKMSDEIEEEASLDDVHCATIPVYEQ